MSVTEATTRTLDAPAATLTYDVRSGGLADEVSIFLIGSPMAGFGSLAGHLPDRRLITHEPRGFERSTKDDPTTASTAVQHADGPHQAPAEGLGTQPVVVFPSGHGRVLGGKYGQSGDPDAFAAKPSDVLEER
jgi:hypothetical protein